MQADEDTVRADRDILSKRLTTIFVYVLPIIAVSIASRIDIGPLWRTAVWVAALTTMGAGCLFNALRCGRIHCYFTGPFFLILALTALLYGLGAIQLGTRGWSEISIVAVLGGLFLFYVPEAISGKYRRPTR